jgi:hypothetical protein
MCLLAEADLASPAAIIQAIAGGASVVFSSEITAHNLPPGRYRVVARTPVDTGNPAKGTVQQPVFGVLASADFSTVVVGAGAALIGALSGVIVGAGDGDVVVVRIHSRTQRIFAGFIDPSGATVSITFALSRLGD